MLLDAGFGVLRPLWPSASGRRVSSPPAAVLYVPPRRGCELLPAIGGEASWVPLVALMVRELSGDVNSEVGSLARRCALPLEVELSWL